MWFFIAPTHARTGVAQDFRCEHMWGMTRGHAGMSLQNGMEYSSVCDDTIMRHIGYTLEGPLGPIGQSLDVSRKTSPVINWHLVFLLSSLSHSVFDFVAARSDFANNVMRLCVQSRICI